jgi:hypothetical protein
MQEPEKAALLSLRPLHSLHRGSKSSIQFLIIFLEFKPIRSVCIYFLKATSYSYISSSNFRRKEDNSPRYTIKRVLWVFMIRHKPERLLQKKL